MNEREEREFADFVRAQSGRLFRTAYLLTGDHGHAEDLVQSTLTAVYLRWGRIGQLDQPGAYARRMLVNGAISRARRRSVREVPLIAARDVPAPDRADAGADSVTVWNAVLGLPARQRAVVVLRYYEDLTEAETADVLGIAIGTVKSHAHAAAQTLAAVLGAEERTTSRSRSPS